MLYISDLQSKLTDMPYNLLDIEDRTVLYVDYRNLSSAGIIDLARKIEEITKGLDKGVMFIVNVTDVTFSTQLFLQLMSEKVGQSFSEKHKCVVFIGVIGLKKILLKLFANMVRVNAFHKNSDKEALDFVREMIYTELALRV